jgi:disulfide oxidoreductase YuzD
MIQIGCTSAYTTNLPTTPFSEPRKQALVECIRRRHYNFNHFDHEYMDYCAPVYEDHKICVLTKAQFDEVMDLAYAEISMGQRLMPSDAIKREAIDGVLFEKDKYQNEWCDGNG